MVLWNSLAFFNKWPCRLFLLFNMFILNNISVLFGTSDIYISKQATIYIDVAYSGSMIDLLYEFVGNTYHILGNTTIKINIVIAHNNCITMVSFMHYLCTGNFTDMSDFNVLHFHCLKAMK